MKRVLYLAACVGLASLMSGCACNDYSFRNPFKNQPVRTKIRSWFQGDACSTCNAPAGRINWGTNVAPLCDDCATPSIGQPVYSDPGVQLYGEPSLNGPIYDQGIQNPSPIYSEGAQFDTDISIGEISNAAYGSGIVNEVEPPPNF